MLFNQGVSDSDLLPWNFPCTINLLLCYKDEVQLTQTLSFSIPLSIHPSFGANSIKAQLQSPKQSCRQCTSLLILPASSYHPLFPFLTHRLAVWKELAKLLFISDLQTLKFPWITSTCHTLWKSRRRSFAPRAPSQLETTHKRTYQTDNRVCIPNDSDQFNFML